VSIPPSDKAKVAAVRFPARVSVNVTPRADCRGVEWFCGDTEWMKGRSASRAVYNEDGIDSGSVPRNGASTEGVDSWRDLRHGEDKSLGRRKYIP
jgi:hypothetical protein